MILRIHRSNFRLDGYDEGVSRQALVELGQAVGVPVVEDLGSGTLVDLKPYGLPFEPTVGQVLGEGVAAVTFSGDKLLGGPQAGLIAGRRDLIEILRRDHLLRCLRVGKVTTALLCRVLDHYIAGEHESLPFYRMLTVSDDELWRRGRDLLAARSWRHLSLRLITSEAQIGSGACPGFVMPSVAVVIVRADASPDELASRARQLVTPIIGRVGDEGFLVDLRSLLPGDLPELAAGLGALDA